MVRSTTTRPQAPSYKELCAIRFQVNLGYRVDDKSHSYLRKREQEQDADWENYFTKRARQFSNGFPDEWDPEVLDVLNEYGETPEEAYDRYISELDNDSVDTLLFNEWRAEERAAQLRLEREWARESYRDFERPCTCIGPCIYPKGALHPTQKEKEVFATAISKPNRLSRRELDQREFARRHQRKLNAGPGLKQFSTPASVGQQIGYVPGSRKR